jgi:hypothetical protein
VPQTIDSTSDPVRRQVGETAIELVLADSGAGSGIKLPIFSNLTLGQVYKGLEVAVEGHFWPLFPELRSGFIRIWPGTCPWVVRLISPAALSR